MRTASSSTIGAQRRTFRHSPALYRRRWQFVAYDRGTSKMLKYDLEATSYSWGTGGDFAGGFLGVHGFSSIRKGISTSPKWIRARAKFAPRQGVNPNFW